MRMKKLFLLLLLLMLSVTLGAQTDYTTERLAFLGALAGLAPALRAMNIKPVEAMHDE